MSVLIKGNCISAASWWVIVEVAWILDLLTDWKCSLFFPSACDQKVVFFFCFFNKCILITWLSLILLVYSGQQSITSLNLISNFFVLTSLDNYACYFIIIFSQPCNFLPADSHFLLKTKSASLLIHMQMQMHIQEVQKSYMWLMSLQGRMGTDTMILSHVSYPQQPQNKLFEVLVRKHIHTCRPQWIST